MKVPDPSITENCNRTLRIGVNYESIRDELLIQKFFLIIMYLLALFF